MKKTILISTVVLVAGIIYFLQSGATSSKLTLKSVDNTEQKVVISTSYGDIKIKLYDKTFQHRDNFVKLVKSAYYDGLLFHRVIKGFMIQGGDPNSKNADSTKALGFGGPGYTVPAEILYDTMSIEQAAGFKKVPVLKYIHKKGAIAAARDNNPAKASSGSQFYIVQGKTYSEQELKNTGKTYTKEQIETYKTLGGVPFLDGDYTVFGEVYEGLDVIDKIAAVKTRPGDRPVKDVKMTIRMIEK